MLNCNISKVVYSIQAAGLMFPALMSRLQTSLYRRTGLPAGLELVVSYL